MSVISRSALESSSLADLHEIASELGLDGYRRLRKADLIGAIIERQGGDEDVAAAPAEADEAVEAVADGGADEDGKDDDDRPARRSRRGGRGRSRTRDRDPGDVEEDDAPQAEATPAATARSAVARSVYVEALEICRSRRRRSRSSASVFPTWRARV